MTVNTTVTLLAAALFFAPAPLSGQEVPLSGEWPPVRRGVWRLESTRVLPNGKKHSWSETQTACHNPADLFMDYWGLGRLERAGCRYYASKKTQHEYAIQSECMVRRAGKAVSEEQVAVLDQDSFERQVTVTEGKKKYSAHQIGHRISDCEPAKSEPAK